MNKYEASNKKELSNSALSQCPPRIQDPVPERKCNVTRDAVRIYYGAGSPVNNSLPTVQRMAIRAQEPPRGQEDHFDRSGRIALHYAPGDHIFYTAANDHAQIEMQENVAFYGHGSSNRIGDCTAEEVAQLVDSLLPPPVVVSHIAQDDEETQAPPVYERWDNNVYLLGCKTGRSYENPPDTESLADKVSREFNTLQNHKEGNLRQGSINIIGSFLNTQTRETGDGLVKMSMSPARILQEHFEEGRQPARLADSADAVAIARTVNFLKGFPDKLSLCYDYYMLTADIQKCHPMPYNNNPADARKIVFKQLNKLETSLDIYRKDVMALTPAVTEDAKKYLLDFIYHCKIIRYQFYQQLLNFHFALNRISTSSDPQLVERTNLNNLVQNKPAFRTLNDYNVFFTYWFGLSSFVLAALSDVTIKHYTNIFLDPNHAMEPVDFNNPLESYHTKPRHIP